MFPQFKRRSYQYTPKSKTLNIEVDKLKTLLEKKREYIGMQPTDILMSVITILSIAITILCIDSFPNNTVRIIAYVAICMCVLYVVVMVIYNTVKRYDHEMLFADICGSSDNIITISHVVIRYNTKADGKILQIYERERRCNLFPNFEIISYSEDADESIYIKEIADKFNNSTGSKIIADDLHFIGDMKEIKPGPKGNMKNYLFRFYLINEPANTDGEQFVYFGQKLSWMSIDDMMSDKKMMRNNEGVIRHVRKMLLSS